MDFQSMLSKLKRDASSQPPPTKESSLAPPEKRRKTMKEQQSNDVDFHKNHPFPKCKVSTVYLACPPNVATGGPEAMHQLCHKINSMSAILDCGGLKAYMLFIKEQERNVIHVPNAKIVNAYKSIYSNLKVASSFPMFDTNEGIEASSNKVKGGNDDDDNLLYNNSLIIWPECWTDLIDSFQPDTQHENKRYQTAIWWLSVNNNNSKFKDWFRKDILHFYLSTKK